MGRQESKGREGAEGMLMNGRATPTFELVKLTNDRQPTVGYAYSCTTRCIGRNGMPEPNTLVRYNSKINMQR